MKIYLHTSQSRDPQVVDHPPDALLSEALASGDDAVVVLLEDGDEPLDLGATLADAKIADKSHVHVSRRTHVDVTVNFNADSKQDRFPVSARVERVLKWAVKEFDLGKADAADHTLALCGTDDVPAGDAHLDALAGESETLCFDLVPKHRFEG